MTRDELQAKIDELTAIRDALPLPDAELVQELTRLQMDGEHAADENSSNYADAGQGWRDVTASGVRAVLARLRELGWCAPDEPRLLPKGVTVDDVAVILADWAGYEWADLVESSREFSRTQATELLDLLNIEH